MVKLGRILTGLAVAAAIATPAMAQVRSDIVIPAMTEGLSRNLTVDDVVRRRIADTLAISPDRRRFAMFVRQARPEANDFRTGWFVGSVDGGPLIRVGDGGELLPTVMWTGHMPGMISGGQARWSPDQQWIAYTLRRGGEVQLWRSRTDGSRQEQLTHAAGDVRDFAWAGDGRAIHFRAERPRAEQALDLEARMRTGIRYREDLWQFTDLMGPDLIRPRPVDPTVRTVTFNETGVRSATAAERADFERQLIVPAPVAPPSADHRACADAGGGERLCILATTVRPDRIVAVGAGGTSREVADLNPEYRQLVTARVERIEWPTPRYAWNAPSGPLHDLYPDRAYGYVIYPPDYVPGRRYPLFIDPYVADGFSTVGDEHALLAYAASGMIVLRSGNPPLSERARARLGPAMLRTMYEPKLGYPHLNLLMDSTLVALDMLVSRGLVDPNRVGIGGVSHGTFVPLYMIQRHDRIAAISVSSPNWGFMQYYWSSRPGDPALGVGFPSPEGPGREFWRGIDIADHLGEIEAPILMNLAASESYAMVRLIRLLTDADMAHDAYIFPRETHLKWQPAHLDAIMRRNLDWFRFWLQDAEDSDPAKAGQYARWRALRVAQCRNPRSVRDYCRPRS